MAYLALVSDSNLSLYKPKGQLERKKAKDRWNGNRGGNQKISSCYGQDICVPPKFILEALNPNGKVFGDEALER